MWEKTADVKVAIDDPVDPLEAVITVGFPVLLLVLPNELLTVAVYDFVQDSTTAGTVRLVLCFRFQCIDKAHTIEYRPGATLASRHGIGGVKNAARCVSPKRPGTDLSA